MRPITNSDRRQFLKTATIGAAGLSAAAFGLRLAGPYQLEIPEVLAGSNPGPRLHLGDDGPIPDLSGATGWLNSEPLTDKALRGRVVLINFWTYSCINSLRPLPYLKSWAKKYSDAGMVVIGIHTPEFPFEKEGANVQQALLDYEITYPVALDSNYAVWQAFNNQYWPAFYFVDAKGRVRHHQFGEGEYLRICLSWCYLLCSYFGYSNG